MRYKRQAQVSVELVWSVLYMLTLLYTAYSRIRSSSGRIVTQQQYSSILHSSRKYHSTLYMLVRHSNCCFFLWQRRLVRAIAKVVASFLSPTYYPVVTSTHHPASPRYRSDSNHGGGARQTSINRHPSNQGFSGVVRMW